MGELFSGEFDREGGKGGGLAVENSSWVNSPRTFSKT